MRDIRALIGVSLVLVCGCGNGDEEGSATDTGTDAVSPEAGASDAGTQQEGGAGNGNFDGGGTHDGGGGGQLDGAAGDGAARDGGVDGGGARDGGDGGGMDAAAEAGTVQDAGRDSGPKTINGFPVGDHCAPGVYDPMFSPFCEDLDGGLQHALESGIGATPSVSTTVRWQRLPAPMTANQPYALSLEMDVFSPPATQQFEVWGSMSPCATGGEQSDRLGLAALSAGSQVYCLDMHPTKAYSHVMMVFRKITEGNGTGQHGQTFCSMGACPVR